MTSADATPTLWGIHAGKFDDVETPFLVYGYIAVGWPEMRGLGELDASFEAFKEQVQRVYPDATPPHVSQDASQLYSFVHEMKVGDYITYRPKADIQGTDYVFLGRVTGPYLYNPFLNPNYPDVRRVEWLRSVPVDRFTEDARNTLGAGRSLFRISNHAAEFLAVIAESK